MCMWCGRIDDTLVGHHIDSWGASGNDDLSNVITLCGRCHGDIGQGYLDLSICNHRDILRDASRGKMLGAGVSERDSRLWDGNKYLKRIMEAR